MAEQILDSFPELSRYDLSSFRVKDLHEYVKDKIIEKNPEFVNLIWNDYSIDVEEIDVPANNDESPAFTDGRIRLRLTRNEDRRRYYKNKNDYNFTYRHIDTAAKWQTFFEGVHGKTFKYELKDKFQEKLQEAQTDPRIQLTFIETNTTDDEVTLLIATELITKNKAGEEKVGSGSNNTMYLSSNGIHIHKNISSYWSDFIKNNYVWVRFAKDVIPEDQMISGPAQPHDSNLDTRLNDAFTN